jgi:hypothetical protein
LVHPWQVEYPGHGEVIGVFHDERLEVGGHELARVEAMDQLCARASKLHVQPGKKAPVFER